MQRQGGLRRSAEKQKQDHPSQQLEEERVARDHEVRQHRQLPVATLVSAARPDEASAAVTQREVELVVALGEGCVLVAEDEAPNEPHAGPCAIRYSNDTQINTSVTSLAASMVRFPPVRLLRSHGPVSMPETAKRAR